jgi:hypothetical protein
MLARHNVPERGITKSPNYDVEWVSLIYLIKFDFELIKNFVLQYEAQFIHSFSILSDDRSKASSKTIPPHSAI